MAISCSFNAKPVANITWIYDEVGTPDIHVLNITTHEMDNNKYITTTSNLSWKTTNEDKRNSITGNYTCIARNYLGNDVSRTATIDIRCEFFNT